MLSPYAIHHLLKHFDSIDRCVSRYFTYPRPKDEEQLTGTLVDLFDENVQRQENVAYGLDKLRADLKEASEPISVNFGLETHKYTKEWEGRVTQADLGLVVKYENIYEPSLSGKRSWLLQAKRLFPLSLNPTVYGTGSKFTSWDNEQERKIRQLIRFLNGDKDSNHPKYIDFFRHLLFCPRPSCLDEKTRFALSYQRTRALSGELFDFAYGLELRDDLRNNHQTVGAGIFLSTVENFPETLLSVHEQIFGDVTPLSWFLIQHIPVGRSRSSRQQCLIYGHEENELIERIVSGDREVADDISVMTKGIPLGDFKFLPHSTLNVTITVGPQNYRD